MERKEDKEPRGECPYPARCRLCPRTRHPPCHRTAPHPLPGSLLEPSWENGQEREANHPPRPCQLFLPTSRELSPFTTTPTHQYGVPTKELAGAMMDAEPKSPSFTKPGSDSRMFPAFTSLPEAKHKDKTCISKKAGQVLLHQVSKKTGAQQNEEWCKEHHPRPPTPATASHRQCCLYLWIMLWECR